jgi:hypothetical protein
MRADSSTRRRGPVHAPAGAVDTGLASSSHAWESWSGIWLNEAFTTSVAVCAVSTCGRLGSTEASDFESWLLGPDISTEYCLRLACPQVPTCAPDERRHVSC